MNIEKQALIFGLTLSFGCLGRIDRYDLADDQVLIGFGEKLRSCPLTTSFVGAADYASNPDCEELAIDQDLGSSWLTGGDAILFRGSSNASSVRASCLSTSCKDLVLFDLGSKMSSVVAKEVPIAVAREDERWVVWTDLRNDRNGLCRWPAGDEDCAVDLYAYDRVTQTERRITASSTVFPPVDFRGFDAFAIDGDTVVYVDAGDPSCGELKVSNRAAICQSNVRAFDLESGVERMLSTPGRSAQRVRAGGGAVAWLERLDDGTFELLHSFLSSDAGRTAIGVRALTLNFEVDGEWVVYEGADGETPIISAIDVRTGEQRLLTEEGEAGVGPGVKNGRVAWIDPDRTSVSVYELATGARQVVVSQ